MLCEVTHYIEHTCIWDYTAHCQDCAGWGLVLCLQVSRSAQDHEDITNALFYSILTDPATAPKVNTHI